MNLKTILLIFGIIALQLSSFAEGDGFGENPGGAGGDTVVVDNTDDLKHYAGLIEPMVIFVKDTIDVGSDLRISSFKTLSGLDSTSTILGNINIKAGTNNVVVKNLNISNPANDGITIRNAQYVYVTNCTVYDCADGCIDVTVESDFVTISYCRFYYDKVTFHKFVNLIGADDADVTDRGKLHVTMHNNWWDTGCTSRMPRVRFGRVHVYNNYFSCVGNNYCNRAAIDAELFSERNYFEGVRDPLTTDQNGKAKSLENEYVNCEGTIHPGTDEIFIPSYSYSAKSASEAKEEVIQFAGNKKRTSDENQKKETIINWGDQTDMIFGTPLSEQQLNATAFGNTSTPIYSHPVGSQLPEGYNTITVTFPEDENYKAASKTVNIKVNYEYFSLIVGITEGVNSRLIDVSPQGIVSDSILKYPKGTEVYVTALSNPISVFKHWDDGDTSVTKSFVMNGDVGLFATYEKFNYIVGWDFYSIGNRDRTADYFTSNENETAKFQLKIQSGIPMSWEQHSAINNDEWFGKNAAVIGKSMNYAGNFYFEMAFNAEKFKNIKICASMLGVRTYYQVQNVEYSVDGSNFTKIGSFNIEQDSIWYNGEFQLPDIVDGSSSVIVRFTADKSSILTGIGDLGTSVSDVFVLADERNSTSVRTLKTNARIVSKKYFSLDGKQLSRPGKGINIEIIIYDDGSYEAKKIYYNY